MADTRQSDSQSDRGDAVVERDPMEPLLEQKKKLEQLNSWFDIALNNMVVGCLFSTPIST